MQDLTKITTPFGLLDPETQEALRAHGGSYERYSSKGWVDSHAPVWYVENAYRVKPQPPKPREWWIVGGCSAYKSKTAAVNAVQSFIPPSIVHVREVL